jgi:hypothetical protein
MPHFVVCFCLFSSFAIITSTFWGSFSLKASNIQAESSQIYSLTFWLQRLPALELWRFCVWWFCFLHFWQAYSLSLQTGRQELSTLDGSGSYYSCEPEAYSLILAFLAHLKIIFILPETIDCFHFVLILAQYSLFPWRTVLPPHPLLCDSHGTVNHVIAWTQQLSGLVNHFILPFWLHWLVQTQPDDSSNAGEPNEF